MINKKLEPSLLAFDFPNINEQLLEYQKIGIDTIHYDIIDPNYAQTKQPYYLEHIFPILEKGFYVNVHVMAKDPSKFINDLLLINKISTLTFQYETINKEKTIQLLNLISNAGIKQGIAIKPFAKPDEYLDFLSKCKIITFMTVEPGKGGQAFLNEAVENLKFLFEYRQKHNLSYIIEVDGGINLNTIEKVIDYADYFISGTGFVKANINERELFLNIIGVANEKRK